MRQNICRGYFAFDRTQMVDTYHSTMFTLLLDLNVISEQRVTWLAEMSIRLDLDWTGNGLW